MKLRITNINIIIIDTMNMKILINKNSSFCIFIKNHLIKINRILFSTFLWPKFAFVSRSFNVKIVKNLTHRSFQYGADVATKKIASFFFQFVKNDRLLQCPKSTMNENLKLFGKKFCCKGLWLTYRGFWALSQFQFQYQQHVGL